MKKLVNGFKSIISFFIVFEILLSVPIIKANAAIVTAAVNKYSYVKPAPYWTCSPCDEFPASTSVKILERDYNFFYIEYTKDGIVKRGYTPMSNFNSSDYSGYSWCNHSIFTTGYNITGVAKNTFYGPSSNYSKFGAIDADEGTNIEKPLLVLRTSGNYSFVQYVTNPGETGNPLFKRA